MADKLSRQKSIAGIFAFASACTATLLSSQHSTPAEPIDGGSSACSTPRQQSAISAARGSEREASSSEQTNDRVGIDAAFNFLDAQMDMFHKSTIIYSEPSFSAYYPSGKIGDVGDISIDSEFRGSSHSGRASLRIDYRPTLSSSLGWASVSSIPMAIGDNLLAGISQAQLGFHSGCVPIVTRMPRSFSAGSETRALHILTVKETSDK